MHRALLLLTFVVLAQPCQAQWGQRYRGQNVDTLTVPAERLLKLRPFVVPGSLVVYHGGVAIDTSRYSIDERFGQLRLDSSIEPADTVVVRYEALPLTFKDVYRSRALINVDSDVSEADVGLEYPTESPRPNSPVDDIFGPSRLQKSGSITRGVIAGNNQDATIESGLRMQLSGEIIDGVNLRAVLTDENTPILPEGTTQRINEFDRVFIEVSSRHGAAQLGDFDLSFTGSEFGQFNRKLQGAKLVGRAPAFGGVVASGTATVAGATSRGTYRSQEIDGVEGVQGPYRLEGSSGERFIIVVPGTEEVYIDGRRLDRGESNDYVIDYATAELTFTPRQLITANKRIAVEFQYSTNQFTRSLLAAHTSSVFGTANQEAGRLSLTVIREADSREFNDEFGLTSADSLLLAQSGDGVASRSGAEQVAYDPEAPFVQYVREERTLPDATTDTVFVALSSEPSEGVPVFRVQFTRVGQGNGRYVRIGQAVNGILYEFRGRGLGEYEPVRVLPKPRLQQVVDLAGEVRPVAGIRLFGEWAASTNNQNRLSSLDSSDDNGHAFTLGIGTPKIRIGLGATALAFEARRRFVHSDFRSFNRIRPVEFGRRWNLDARSAEVSGGNSFGTNEATNEITGTIHFGDDSYLRGEWGSIQFGSRFDAVRRAGALNLESSSGRSVAYDAEYITSDDRGLARSGEWLRQIGRISYAGLVANITPSIEVEHEDRRQLDLAADSLTPGSLAFVELRPAISYTGNQFEVGVGLDWRTEDLVVDGSLGHAATGWTVRTNFGYSAGTLFSTDGNIGFRRRRFTERFRLEQARQNSESVVLRWKGSYRPIQRAVDVSWFYEAQTERTPKLQEIYIRTGPDLGQFVWTDFNGDGAIQIDEFVPETTPNEGTYVKTFVPSDTLFSIIGVQARLRLGLEPGRKWRTSDEAWKRALGQVSTRTTIEVVEKSQEQDLKQVYFLNLNRFRKPGSTLNGRLVLRQEVSLFRNRTDIGLDLTFNQVRTLTDLAAGLEERFINLWEARGRLRPLQLITTGLTVATETNRVDSESFVSRQYDLRTIRLVPEISYSPSRAWQIKLQTDFASKKDRRFDRSARLLKVPVEVRHNRARKLQISGRLEIADIQLRGSADGFAQFELTDGRGPGTSMLWSAGVQYSINQFIRATFNYDGRAPANAPTLHTLRMQVSAIF